MKKLALVVVLALVLTFAFATAASATTFKGYGAGQAYYTWTKAPVPAGALSGTTPNGLSGVGSNPTNPGAHANYLATTAKCGMCHSVHRATAGGVKLLPTADATCAGCHTGSTAVTAKVITWTAVDTNWLPEVDAANPLYPVGSAAWMAAAPADRYAAITNLAAAGGANNQGGPHNDSAATLIEDGFWDGTGATPQPSFEEGHRYGCWTRRCHATNPHGAGASQYKLIAAKLLFNNSPAEDAAELGVADTDADGYGGLDAVYNNLGAMDASVQRFIDENPAIVQAVDDGSGKFDIQINKNASGFRAPDAAETHALVAGLTCGRPSVGDNGIGNDECHAEASYAIVDKGITEMRNKSTMITRGIYSPDNTGEEVVGWGGNDSRTLKTAHVAGTFAAVPGSGSYAGVSGCTSCHDQTDSANTEPGNFTFPHGQTPAGTTNLADNSSSTPQRARIWMGYASNVGAPLTSVGTTNEKAYDGNCLKCHRDAAGTAGIGLTK